MEDQDHYPYKNRDGRIFPCENAVELFAPDTLLTLFWLVHALVADSLDEIKAHIRDRDSSLHTALALHLESEVFKCLDFVWVKLQLFYYQFVAFHRLCGRKANRKIGSFRVILDKA